MNILYVSVQTQLISLLLILDSQMYPANSVTATHRDCYTV